MVLNAKCFLVAVLFCFLPVVLKPAEAWDKFAARSLSHYIMGVIYEDLEDFDQAIQEYQKATKSDVQNADLRLKLASSYIKKNNIEAAIGQLKLAIAADPAAVQPHALLSLLYSLQKKEAPALTEYEAALKSASCLEPENIEVYKGLGAVYLRQNKLIQARGVYKLVIGLSPKDPEAYFYLGSVDYELNDMHAADNALGVRDAVGGEAGVDGVQRRLEIVEVALQHCLGDVLFDGFAVLQHVHDRLIDRRDFGVHHFFEHFLGGRRLHGVNADQQQRQARKQ